MTRIACLLVSSVALFSLVINASAGAAPPPKTKPDTAVSGSTDNRPPSLIDINSATLTDLRSLPGIGTATAHKIVAGRPYASVDDLKARKLLSNGTYDRIRDRISAKRSMSGGTTEKPDMSVSGTSMH